MLCQCVKFHSIPLNTFRDMLEANKIFVAKVTNAYNLTRTSNRVMVLLILTSSYCLLSMNQVSFDSFNTLKETLKTNLLLEKNRKGNSSLIICNRVIDLALCIFSDGRLLMYQVSFDSLFYLQRYAPDKLFIAKIKKENNSVTTCDKVTIFSLCTFSVGLLSIY